jgi:hypothetical protein
LVSYGIYGKEEAKRDKFTGVEVKKLNGKI